MATASYLSNIYCTTADTAPTSPDLIKGVTDVSFSLAPDELDTTSLNNTAGNRSRMYGLLDGSFSISGDYEESDTAQSRLRSAASGRTTVFIHYRPTGGAGGYKSQVVVTSFEVSSSAADKVTFSCEMAVSGAITAT
jgi:tail tube protein